MLVEDQASSVHFHDSSAYTGLSRRASDYLIASFGSQCAIQRLFGIACEVPTQSGVNTRREDCRILPTSSSSALR